jgi:hypothetical protein
VAGLRIFGHETKFGAAKGTKRHEKFGEADSPVLFSDVGAMNALHARFFSCFFVPLAAPNFVSWPIKSR